MTDQELQAANEALLRRREALRQERSQTEPSGIANSMPLPKPSPMTRFTVLPPIICGCGAELYGGQKCEPCRVKRQQAEHDAAIADPRPWMREHGVPTGFLDLTWTLPEWATAYVTSPKGLCVTGPTGTGKTATLCLLMRESYRAGMRSGAVPTWRFLSFPAFVMQLQDAWRKDNAEQTAYGLLTEVAKVPHLILDDLGAEKLTDYIRQATYFLLNEREQWQRPTYLTTNFSLSQLDGQLDSRISSRIAGMCDVKALQGKDRRLRA